MSEENGKTGAGDATPLTRKRFLAVSATALGGVVLGACGSDDNGAATSTGAGSTTTTGTATTAAKDDVVYDGEVFDAGGETLKLAMWGGFWAELTNKLVLRDFKRDFNCNIEYDGNFPWYPKMVAAGGDAAYDVVNMNSDQIVQAKRFFVPQEELVANVPESKKLWPFAIEKSPDIPGIVWGFGICVIPYRTDVAKPTGLLSLADAAYARKRGTYAAENGHNAYILQELGRLVGKDDYDLDAAIGWLKEHRPWKLVPYTGNMTEALQRGEVAIATTHYLPEVLTAKQEGAPIDFVYWERKGVQDQTLNVVANSKKKKLAYALVNRYCAIQSQERYLDALNQLTAHKEAKIPAALTELGITNDAAAWENAWFPDYKWYVDNNQEITQKLNEAFGG